MEKEQESVAEAFGRRLSDARKRAGYTQQELGEALGFSLQTVSAWEQGRREPNLATLVKISKALGIGTSELLPFADEPVEVLDLRTLSRQLGTLRRDHYRLVDQLTTDGILAAAA